MNDFNANSPRLVLLAGMAMTMVSDTRAKCSASCGKMGWNAVTALEARKNRGLQVA
jgi:hypothetical protein